MMRKTLAGIAQIMRWGFIDTDSGGILSDNQVERCPWERIEDAHLLIERMVVDGWDIDVCWSAKANEIICVATKCDNGGYIEHRLKDSDFPAAVVELFCKVYDIRED